MILSSERAPGRRGATIIAVLIILTLLAMGCSGSNVRPAPATTTLDEGPYYQIGPGDVLEVFVWGSQELSRTVKVRPDGRISFPLVGDIKAAARTPGDLADDLDRQLTPFIFEPHVAIMVVEFSGTFAQQIRVIGEAQKPLAIPYRENMTLLDVMIEVGGLTEFASGNRAVIERTVAGKREEYRVRLDDLIRDGDIGANVQMAPGDILIIPQRYL